VSVKFAAYFLLLQRYSLQAYLHCMVIGTPAMDVVGRRRLPRFHSEFQAVLLLGRLFCCFELWVAASHLQLVTWYQGLC